MADRVRVVSFLSDFGLVDESVAVCKGVIHELAPHVTVLDVTHDVPPHDVRAGALTLVRAAQYLPGGIVLACVDPGSGTDRRLLAVEVEHGFLLGPDNGLLAPTVAMVGGPQRVVALTNRDYQLEAPGATFAARDVLAPAAGHLASGVPLDALGDPVDPASLTPALLPLAQEEDGALVGEVLWIDRFGNCQLNVDPDDLRARGVGPGDAVEVTIGETARRARWVGAYADAKPSELVLVVDAYGLLSLCEHRRSAAEAHRMRVGTPVRVVSDPALAGGGPADPARGATIPVQLGVPPRGGAG